MTLIYKPDFALNTNSNKWIRKNSKIYANLSKKHVIESDFEYESSFIDDNYIYQIDSKSENDYESLTKTVNVQQQTESYEEIYELTIKKNNKSFQKITWNNKNTIETPIKNWKWNEQNKNKKQRLY